MMKFRKGTIKEERFLYLFTCVFPRDERLDVLQRNKISNEETHKKANSIIPFLMGIDTEQKHNNEEDSNSGLRLFPLFESRKDASVVERNGMSTSEAAYRLLHHYAYNPGISMVEGFTVVSISRTVGMKAVKELTAKALAKEHRVSHFVYMEILKDGEKFLGVQAKQLPGKGDFKHRVIQHHINRYCNGNGEYNRVVTEEYLNGKLIDVAGYRNGGGIDIFEVFTSPHHVIENIEKDIATGAKIRCFYIVAIDSKVKKSIEKTIKKAGIDLKIIKIVLAKNFLK